jgi:hypothetical protein
MNGTTLAKSAKKRMTLAKDAKTAKVGKSGRNLIAAQGEEHQSIGHSLVLRRRAAARNIFPFYLDLPLRSLRTLREYSGLPLSCDLYGASICLR